MVAHDDPKTVWDVVPHPQGRDLPIGDQKVRFRAIRELREQSDSDELGNALFRRFAPELAGCTTGEMKSRPVPHAFRTPTSQMKALNPVFVKYIRPLLRFLFRRAHIRAQTFDTKGGIGEPVWKTTPRKLQEIRPYWDEYVRGDYSSLRGCRVIANVRTQPERADKKRLFTFVDKHGVPYLKEVDRQFRAAEDGWVHMRTRLVFRYPVPNTMTQLVDSLLHDVFLRSAINHFTGLVGTKLPAPYYYFGDVSHFERVIGMLVAEWSAAIGGGYQILMDKMLAAPFIIPSDDWSTTFALTPKAGAYVQLGSGVSPVTTIAKAVFWIIYAIVEMELGGATFEEALDRLWSNKCSGFGIMNYGDDNVVYSTSKARLEEVKVIVARYMTIEEEVPPAFLGHNYHDDVGFRLRAKSYLANFWLAERPPHSIFRPYPNYGFAMRREIYSQDGESVVAKSIIPEENRLLRKYGVEPADIYARAAREKAMIGDEPYNRLVGKEYLLTEEEKARLPDFQVLPADQVAHYLKYLLSEQSYAKQ